MTLVSGGCAPWPEEPGQENLLSLDVSPELHTALKVAAAKRRITMSELMRQLLQSALAILDTGPNAYHAARPDVVLGLLTGQVAAATSPTDYRLKDWDAAGLYIPTAFRTFLITLPQVDVVAVIGRLSEQDWIAVQARLRSSIAV